MEKNDSVRTNHSLQNLMQATMDKIHEMVDTNAIVGAPIRTDNGVTLIPVSKVSFGFASGGGDYGKASAQDHFGGGSTAGAKIDPVAFLIIKNGSARLMPVVSSPMNTVDRVIDLVPNVMDRAESLIASRKQGGEPVEVTEE